MRQCCLQRTICGKIYSCILLCVKIPILHTNFCCRPDFLRTPLLIGILTSCSPDKSELLSLDQYTQEDMYISVTPEEIRYVRPQVAPNELGQGGSTARQVLTKFCISYWYVGPYMLEEWMIENVASVFGSLRICCCMVRVVCCTFRGPRLGRFGFWPACVPQPNRFLPAWLFNFFVHPFRQESCTTYR